MNLDDVEEIEEDAMNLDEVENSPALIEVEIDIYNFTDEHCSLPSRKRNVPKIGQGSKRPSIATTNTDGISSEDSDTDSPRPAKRAHRMSHEGQLDSKQKVQSDTLLRTAELDSGDSDSEVPSLVQRPARKLLRGRRPMEKAYTRRKSQASLEDDE